MSEWDSRCGWRKRGAALRWCLPAYEVCWHRAFVCLRGRECGSAGVGGVKVAQAVRVRGGLRAAESRGAPVGLSACVRLCAPPPRWLCAFLPCVSLCTRLAASPLHHITSSQPITTHNTCEYLPPCTTSSAAATATVQRPGIDRTSTLV